MAVAATSSPLEIQAYDELCFPGLAGLCFILGPQRVTAAREVAAAMTRSAESLASAVDLMQSAVLSA
jgi:hypothetical protein